MTKGQISLHNALHCRTLQHTATHCTHYTTLQHTTQHCNTLQHTANHHCTLQHIVASCATLRLTATHHTTLHRTATHSCTYICIHLCENHELNELCRNSGNSILQRCNHILTHSHSIYHELNWSLKKTPTQRVMSQRRQSQSPNWRQKSKTHQKYNFVGVTNAMGR